MHNCLLNLPLRILDSYAIMFCILLVGICITLRRPKLIVFSLVLTSVYMFNYAIVCAYPEYFKMKKVYRYGVWAGLEFLYIFILVVLAHYRKVRVDQVAYSSIVTFVLILTFLIRMYDNVYLKTGITSLFYSEMLFATNVMYVLIGYFPIFIMFYYKFIAKKEIPYSKWHE